MSSEFAEFMIKIRSRSLLKSTDGFILLHVLLFYMLFTSTLTGILIQKNLSLQQKVFYKMAKTRIETEKEIITVLKNHDDFPAEEELSIAGQFVLITYGDPIKVWICGEVCYSVLIEYDQSSRQILRLDYE